MPLRTRRKCTCHSRNRRATQSAEVFGLVVREGMVLVAIGVVLGLLALLASGLAACVLPARRATKVVAVEALRSE